MMVMMRTMNMIKNHGTSYKCVRRSLRMEYSDMGYIYIMIIIDTDIYMKGLWTLYGASQCKVKTVVSKKNIYVEVVEWNHVERLDSA